MQLLADLYWGVSVNSATRRPGRPGGRRQVYNCQSGAPGPRGTGGVGWLSEHEHMVDVCQMIGDAAIYTTSLMIATWARRLNDAAGEGGRRHDVAAGAAPQSARM